VASFIDSADGKGDTCIGRQTMRQQLKLARVVAKKSQSVVFVAIRIGLR
jgi:hypothetical protein